ncbi:MAG: lytic transglycosylase domain-containing protein [Deltaproteobacteria bacterium]|nr:lytic transglycosylase domain-containing protein [Deltaproteobacteria bacterium]
MGSDPQRQLIRAAALAHGLAPHVLAGLVRVESGGNPWAVRAEPGYRWLVGDDPGEPLLVPPGSTRDTEWACQRLSWGLCQVMGATARELGYAGWLPRLADPALGLEYGARYLARCLARSQGNLVLGLLKYNGGGDPGYPRRVLDAAESCR